VWAYNHWIIALSCCSMNLVISSENSNQMLRIQSYRQLTQNLFVIDVSELLLLDSCEPVDDDRDGRKGRIRRWLKHQEFLTIWCDIILVIGEIRKISSVPRLKQRSGDPCFNVVSDHRDIDRHQLPVWSKVEQFLSISPPTRYSASRTGYLMTVC